MSNPSAWCLVIERNNPHIDVDLLVARIQDEVIRRDLEGDATPARTDFRTPPHAQSIRTLIVTAQRKADVRTAWSSKVNFFPFNLAVVQRFFLRLLGFVFKDQRHVNFAVVQALRELAESNEELRLRVAQLEERQGTTDSSTS